MKSLIATLLTLTVMTGAILQPKQSEAALASAVISIPAAVGEGVVLTSMVATGGAFLTVMLAPFIGPIGGEIVDKAWEPLLSIGYLGFAAALVLDDSGQQKVVLKPIDNKIAKAAGVTTEEQDSYNHELDIIQASFDDISAQVAPLKDSERAPQAAKLWNQYRSAFSPESYSALQKVMTSLANQRQ